MRLWAVATALVLALGVTLLARSEAQSGVWTSASQIETGIAGSAGSLSVLVKKNNKDKDKNESVPANCKVCKVRERSCFRMTCPVGTGLTCKPTPDGGRACCCTKAAG